MLTACAPHKYLNNSHREEMERLVLQVVADWNLHFEFVDYWKVVRQVMEVVAEGMWLDEKKLGRRQFVMAHLDRLSLFMPQNCILSVEKALHEKCDPLASDLRQLLQTRIGAALYQDQSMRLTWLSYLDSVKKGIATLQHNDFSLEEHDSFVKVMKRELVAVINGGGRSFDKKKIAVGFLTVNRMQMETTNINDIWTFQLEALMKGIAVNRNWVPRLPYEKLLWGEDLIEGLPQATNVPAKLLRKFVVVRNSALELLGDGQLTLAEMKAKLTTKEAKKTLTKQNRSWYLEDKFLMDHAEALLTEKVHTAVLQGFKDVKADGQIPYTEALQAIALAKASPQVGALPMTVTKALNAARDFVEELRKGKAPTLDDLKNASPFHMKVVKAAECWCVHTDAKGAGGGSSPATRLCGRAAIEAKYALVDGVCEAQREVHMPDVKEIRRFIWLLNNEQTARVNAWVDQGVKVYRMKALGSAMLADITPKTSAKACKQIEDDGEMECESQSSNSRVVKYKQASTKVLAKLPIAQPNKKKVCETSSTEDSWSALFGKRARTKV